MSVNSKMTAIANAIRAKTGRTDTLTLDEMASAITGIKTGSDAQRKAASFTARYNQNVTVNCGFQPDVLVIFTPTYYMDGSTTVQNLMFFPKEKGSTYNLMVSTAQSDNGYYEGRVTVTATGFNVMMKGYSFSWSGKSSLVDNKAFEFVAVKYST